MTAQTINLFIAIQKASHEYQNSQNRDAKVVQIKLDELIRSIDAARNEVIDIENSPETDLQKLQQDFSGLGSNSKK